MDEKIARKYIRDNFEPADRLAVVVLDKRTGSVTQRIATAERIAAPVFLAWLRYENAQRREVYISMNALRPDARGRTKEDVGAIRHIYLDLDENGPRALHVIFNRQDLPVPSHKVNTSPNKWQVVWRVKGFAKEDAENLQRHLARETGADLAATDCARVLRLPGFYNHKYGRPYLIGTEKLAVAGRIYAPTHFPSYPRNLPEVPLSRHGTPSTRSGTLSQSERDWAFAKRAISRGEPVASVIAAIAEHRRNEKPDPEYYAAYTVRKAAAALAQEQVRAFDLPAEPER